MAARPRRRKLRAAAVATAMLCGVGVAVIAGQAFADDGPRGGHGGRGDRPPAGSPGGPGGGFGGPPAIRPPAGVVPVAKFSVATGTQTYTCKGGVFVAPSIPEARLVAGRRSIHHFGGPSWQSDTDGSLVTATKTAESAVPGAIPELLLTVASHSGDPNGELAAVTFIQRLRTSGGLAPTGPCTDGDKAPVAYGADYVFFAPR